MRANEFITEVFEPGKTNWKWRRQSSDEAFASFVVGDREYQWHAFTGESNPTKWEIQFRLMREKTDPDGLDLFGKTGTGNSAEVLSTAVDITRSFLQTYGLDKVEEITFNAKEDSRIDLYAKMIKRLLPNWDLSSRKSLSYGMQFTLTDPRAYDKPENKITEVQGVAEGLDNIPTIGINVRNDKDIDYASLIVDGKKKYESRKTDSLRPYVGKTVGIVRTGNGPAVAIGQVTIGEPIIVDVEKFNKLRKQHLVPQGSKFDIDSDGTKYLYPMINPVRWDNEKPIKHKGIVSRKIQEQDITESHTQLWHGTSEPIDVIQQQGLRGGRHHAVFLTDNPDLALDYAVSDQERTGNDYVTLITVDVTKLDQKKLVGDLDHTTVDNWIDSLKETDQCMYLGDILPNMITNVEDYTDQ